MAGLADPCSEQKSSRDLPQGDRRIRRTIKDSHHSSSRAFEPREDLLDGEEIVNIAMK